MKLIGVTKLHKKFSPEMVVHGYNPAHRRLRQEICCKFRTIFDYIMSNKQVVAT